MATGSAVEQLAERCGLAAGASLDPTGTPLLDTAEGESLAGTFADVGLVLGDSDQGSGTLFVTSRQIVWVGGASEPRRSYAVSFPEIMMHAVASSSEDFAQPSIYMQLDGAAAADDEEEDGAAPEVRLVPADAAQLDAVFQALCDGAAANPDSDANDDEGDFYYDVDEVAAGAATTGGGGDEHVELAERLDSLLHVPHCFQSPADDGQFSDADEDEDAATPDCPCCRSR